MSERHAARCALRVGGLVVVGLALGVMLGWAGRTLLAPPDPLPAGRSYAMVAVEEGEVARSLNLNATAGWRSGPAVVNGASGTMTQRSARPGTLVKTGDVVYTVDLHPVAAMAGRVPMFRDLSAGDQGTDVRQLQRFLVAVQARQTAPTGRFDAATAAEVQRWQRDVGLPVTGTFARDSVVVIRSLPGVLAWTDEATVGATVEPGTVVAHLLSAEPTFRIVLPEGQRRLVQPGMPVSIHHGDSTWTARLGEVGEVGEDGSATAALVPAEGASSICGTECGDVPLTGDGSLPVTIVVIAPQRGLVVPTAALAVGDDGSTALVDEAGRQVPVTVVASASGQALVTGATPGLRVRVPAGEAG